MASMALAENNKAYFNYELLERLEAGLELTGHEVKAVKAGQLTLVGARVIIRGKESWLIGAEIHPYQPNNLPANYQAKRNIKLLLNKKEISQLETASQTRGLTIIPVKAYNKGGRVKLEIALARGKKKYDKRETIKKRDSDRQIRRTLKSDL